VIHATIRWEGNALAIEPNSHTGPTPRSGSWTERREVLSLEAPGKNITKRVENLPVAKFAATPHSAGAAVTSANCTQRQLIRSGEPACRQAGAPSDSRDLYGSHASCEGQIWTDIKPGFAAAVLLVSSAST
jgi:hypothetical protein